MSEGVDTSCDILTWLVRANVCMNGFARASECCKRIPSSLFNTCVVIFDCCFRIDSEEANRRAIGRVYQLSFVRSSVIMTMKTLINNARVEVFCEIVNRLQD